MQSSFGRPRAGTLQCGTGTSNLGQGDSVTVRCGTNAAVGNGPSIGSTTSLAQAASMAECEDAARSQVFATVKMMRIGRGCSPNLGTHCSAQVSPYGLESEARWLLAWWKLLAARQPLRHPFW